MKSFAPNENSYSRNRSLRALENRRGGGFNYGKPIPGMKTKAFLARVARRQVARRLKKQNRDMQDKIDDQNRRSHEALERAELNDAGR